MNMKRDFILLALLLCGGMVFAQQNRESILENLVNNMVAVEGGTFQMGATEEQGEDIYLNERPAHEVTLSGFSIGKYEVTQEEWEAVMGANPSKVKGKKHPVEQVSWEDCQIFIQKLNELTGKEFRLPTEAEWEYAARGGALSKGFKYAGSNDMSEVGWYRQTEAYPTQDVGKKASNELGLYDMSGNVMEWCSDGYGAYQPEAQTDPKGSEYPSSRVCRGGSWNYRERNCRVSCRADAKASTVASHIGLRLAM